MGLKVGVLGDALLGLALEPALSFSQKQSLTCIEGIEYLVLVFRSYVLFLLCCRMSITFRKMDDAKQPYRFSSDPELTGTKPLVYSPNTKSLAQQQKLLEDNKMAYREPVRVPITAEASNKSIFDEKYDFPVLGSSSFVKNQRVNRYSRKQ